MSKEWRFSHRKLLAWLEADEEPLTAAQERELAAGLAEFDRGDVSQGR